MFQRPEWACAHLAVNESICLINPGRSCPINKQDAPGTLSYKISCYCCGVYRDLSRALPTLYKACIPTDLRSVSK